MRELKQWFCTDEFLSLSPGQNQAEAGEHAVTGGLTSHMNPGRHDTDRRMGAALY